MLHYTGIDYICSLHIVKHICEKKFKFYQGVSLHWQLYGIQMLLVVRAAAVHSSTSSVWDSSTSGGDGLEGTDLQQIV